MQKRQWAMLVATMVLIVSGWLSMAPAQEAAAPAADAVAVAPGLEIKADAVSSTPKGPGFMQIILSAGVLGVLLWLALGACSVIGLALTVDSYITIRNKKIAPADLVEQVRSAMEQGDIMKALKYCEERPVPLAKILSAGFTNVEEGFDAIQDAVAVAADLESEQLVQRINYLNVVANLSTMLGLLGTVQGMIYAFGSLATAAEGAAKQASLALNISQALWTTAAGLTVAVPAIAFFYYFRNRATTIILGMEGQTMDLIKIFRNVEVVKE